MATTSHSSPASGEQGRRWASLRAAPPELWPSLTITVMWLAVLFSALFGPSIEVSNASGTNTSSTPSAVVIALFAFLASWVVARYAFRRDGPK